MRSSSGLLLTPPGHKALRQNEDENWSGGGGLMRHCLEQLQAPQGSKVWHQLLSRSIAAKHGSVKGGLACVTGSVAGAAARLQPLGGAELVWADDGAGLIVQDLGRGAWQAAQARLLQRRQVSPERPAQGPSTLRHLQTTSSTC